MMDQLWFEMADLRRRSFAKAVWIPLRAIHGVHEEGQRGHLGFREEFFGAGSLAIPVGSKKEAMRLGWSDIGIGHEHRGCVDKGRYIPADVHEADPERPFGIALVLEQRINSSEHSVWHLHQDLVVTLGLLREGDKWVCPDEDYTEVARLSRHPNGYPTLMEIRSDLLRDYLCARNMGLYITSYRNREEVVEDASHIGWTDNPFFQGTDDNRWEGRVTAIHEGGTPYGAETAVFHVSRTDIDPGEDVPVFGFPTDENVSSRSWTFGRHERKLFFVQGENWRNEWIDPSEHSPRIRRDHVPGAVFFLTDASGKRESKDTLVRDSRWLWFKPEVIPVLAHRRGGALGWHTRDTGHVRCSPDYKIRFGVNSIGLVNVYAKDIALLPEWQQRIWAAFNVGPEGGVSEELLASQMRAMPADTTAPERRLADAMASLDEVFRTVTGTPLFRGHPHRLELLHRVHRFRAYDRNGLLAQAKDVARLTADSLDTEALQNLVPPPKGEKWGSLKSLEKVLATVVSAADSYTIMTPLFGVYELRLADAHLPSSEADLAMGKAGIDLSKHGIQQGLQLIEKCAEALERIHMVVRSLAKANPGPDAP
ncbi:MAG: hypothetical protein HY896_14080 [Deltaproteobacteria bacterium]|nr:hypothetical protein [Deltaproteobacteria bacterium]